MTTENIQQLPSGIFISCFANMPLVAGEGQQEKRFTFRNFDTDNELEKRRLNEYFPIQGLSFFATSREYEYVITLDTGPTVFLPAGAIANLPLQAGFVNAFDVTCYRQDRTAFADGENARFQISGIGQYGVRGL